MANDLVVPISIATFLMLFGFYYRTISNVYNKKIIGGVVGLCVLIYACGIQSLNIFINTLVNSCIVLFVDKRKCQRYSVLFSFPFQFIFPVVSAYFGIPYATPHVNVIQMMVTLKLIGLAFEVNTSYKAKIKNENETEEKAFENERLQFNLTFLDILCYVFNFCCVFTVPYFRYITYLDHLRNPYHKYDNFLPHIGKQLFGVLCCLVVYLTTNYLWPISYINTEEFLERPFIFRYWYIWPFFVVTRSLMYGNFLFSEIVCVSAGLGVYPEFSKPKSGEGPTQNFKQLKETTDPQVLKNLKYKYFTVQCVDPYKFETVWTIREALRNWNTTVQYWLLTYIYRAFPYKNYRTIATTLASAFGHGLYFGYYCCLTTIAFTLANEDIWVKLVIEGNEGVIAKGVIFFLKMQVISYQGTLMELREFKEVLKYSNSIYQCLLIFYVGMFFVGRYLLNHKKQKTQDTIVRNPSKEDIK